MAAFPLAGCLRLPKAACRHPTRHDCRCLKTTLFPTSIRRPPDVACQTIRRFEIYFDVDFDYKHDYIVSISTRKFLIRHASVARASLSPVQKDDIEMMPFRYRFRLFVVVHVAFDSKVGLEIDMLATNDVESTSFRCRRVFLSHGDALPARVAGN